MSLSFKAILLKKVDYSESNLILQTFTREQGNTSFFAYKPKSKGKRKSALPNMALLEISATKGKGELYRAKEINNYHLLDTLMTNVYKSCIVMFLNEVLLKSIKSYEQDAALFDFVSKALIELDQTEENFENFHLSFILELSRFLGFYPHGQFQDSSTYFDLQEGLFVAQEPLHSAFIPPEDCQDFYTLINNQHLNDPHLKLTLERRRKLLGHLLDYYRIHVAKFDQLKSVEVLEQILS